MRDPDAAERAEALKRNALLAETEANMPPQELSMDGLPYSGPAAFYDDFPEGTNPTATTLLPASENTERESGGEFERWVHGPDGLLVPASSLEKEADPDVTPEDAANEPAADEDVDPQSPTAATPE